MRPGLPFAAWKIEAKLLAAVLIETMALAVWLMFLVVHIASCLAFLWLVSLATFFKIVSVAALTAFAAALYLNVWSVGEEPSDEPLREDLNAYPELGRLVRDVACELTCSAPESAAFLLSPIPWRRFGCDSVGLRDRREISIPVNCLAIWSVLSLRCHIGHSLVRRRPKAWLFYAVRKSLTRLLMERRPKANSSWLQGKHQALIRFYSNNLAVWNILADIEADARIARVLGDSPVATWICQMPLANQVSRSCLQRTIQPAAERGVLLPIASSCATFYELSEPDWLTMIARERVRCRRSQPSSPVPGIALMRLALLPCSSISAYDPRPATTLVPALNSLEEKLIRHEAVLGGRGLRRATISEIGHAVVLPMMRDEVNRNAVALQGHSIADLPDLVRGIPELASLYHPDPRYLLAPGQRQTLVPWLLTSFLAVELERTGWGVGYSITLGLTLGHQGRILCPQQIVVALHKGEMSRESFLKLVNLDLNDQGGVHFPSN